MIVQSGSLNTTALVVPGVYVQIQPPGTQPINGVPSNIVGAVGVASWGPVNSPVFGSGINDLSRIFGPISNRQYDLATFVDIAAKQGSSVFACVRVTDGTDVAATVAIQTNCLTVTSRYTGSLGNNIKVSIGPGSQSGTFSAIVAMPGVAAEKFDNLALGLSGNAIWVAIAAAINSGVYGAAGPSTMVVATAGAGSTTPTTATYSLATGTDGNGSVTATTLIGSDSNPRTGMYALRRTGASVGILVDVTTQATFPTQVAFGLSEGVYMIGAAAAGESLSTSATSKASNGVDSYAFKFCAGDWVRYLDTTTGVYRLTSPASWAAGKLGALSPEQSSLNKPLSAAVGTQTTEANRVYSYAELQVAGVAGIDLVINPSPGGRYFSMAYGHNSSSDPARQQDSYTRMTNYLSATLDANMGQWIGKLNKPSRPKAYASLVAWLSTLQQQGMIDDFQVTLDETNNPDTRVGLGYLQADVKVRYQAIIEKFLINLEGGQTVTISREPALA
mgnify:FL=1